MFASYFSPGASVPKTEQERIDAFVEKGQHPRAVLKLIEELLDGPSEY